MDSEMSEMLDMLYMVVGIYEIYTKLKKLKNSRQFWVRELYVDRTKYGLYYHSFQKLKEDPEQFKKAVRMNLSTFEILNNLLKENLTKCSIRAPIPPECRLFTTLLYSAHGGTRQFHALSQRMGLTTFRRITMETCEVIWDQLAQLYLSLPNQAEWGQIAKDFESLWNMPNCVGAIDGKHVNITCPPRSGSFYYNYKGNYSIVLLGVCDANYTFTAVDIGAYGSQSDGGVLHFSNFSKALQQKKIKLPGRRTLPNSCINFPHYFVGDAAFPLKPYLMRPFPGRLLPEKSEYFNMRLSRARRIIENAFGILTAKWRILRTTLCMVPENAEKIVKATVVLHNFLKLTDSSYIAPEYVDHYSGGGVVKGAWREEVQPLPSVGRISSNRATTNSYVLRDQLRDYLFENKI